MDITHLIEPEIICLDLKANNKEDVLIELVELLDNAGKLTDKQQFLNDIWRREEIGNTGFEEGIAIPHAKSAAVALPAVVVGISRQGIDYGAEDGQLSDVFFMLASPDGEDHHHIEVLAQISSKLIEEGFVEQLKAAESVEQALALFIHPQHSTLSSTQVMDYADYQPLSPMAQRLARVKEHLLFGTSHMMPFIVAGGVLLSLSVMMSGHGAVPEEGVLADIAQMGIAGLTLFTVVLGGYIAYSMADKPGLAPGMIGTWIAINQYQTGFIGAIIVGFFCRLCGSSAEKNRSPRQHEFAGFHLHLSAGGDVCNLWCCDVVNRCTDCQQYAVAQSIFGIDGRFRQSGARSGIGGDDCL